MAYSQFFPNSCMSFHFLSTGLFHCKSVSHFHVAETSLNTKCMPTDNRYWLFLLNHNVPSDPGKPCLSAFTIISSQTTTNEACFPGLQFLKKVRTYLLKFLANYRSFCFKLLAINPFFHCTSAHSHTNHNKPTKIVATSVMMHCFLQGSLRH